MPLTQAEQAEYWQVLKDSPLIQKWPGFRTDVLPRLDPRSYAPGEFVFRPGDRPLHLFIVARGRVLMRLRDTDETWFEQEMAPGGFFGQQALFDEVYRTIARVPSGREPAVLLLVGANDLRVALEKAPALREDLLHEVLAGRLRRIPLFRTLADEQIRWAAHLVQERELPAGASLDLGAEPGLWIIERGQVAVTGPVNPQPADWPVWRLTAGNFFTSIGDLERVSPIMRFGANCAADSVVARFDTGLFYLPAQHADRLITSIKDVGNLVQEPLDIVAAIDSVEPFKSLDARQKQQLAQFFGWEFVPERQNITTQGHPGHSFILLREGAGLITAFDNLGRERPRSAIQAGKGYGNTSLFQGKQRDASVRAVRGEAVRGMPGLAGADILVLDRRDFQQAISEDPKLWSGEDIVRRFQESEEIKPQFPWMQDGEVIRWQGRPHRFWLYLPLALVAGIALLLGALAIALNSQAANITLFLVSVFVLLPIAGFIALNYHDDYYVVTNKRFTRRDRQLVFFEERSEAPVEMIQDVTVDQKFWGRIFGFGDVAVRTSSNTAPIRLENVPEPELVRDRLEAARTDAQAEERGRQKEELRRGLISDLKLALPVPPRQRALGDVSITAPTTTRTLFGRPVGGNGGGDKPGRGLFFGRSRPEERAALPGEIVWHKHWLDAVRRAGPPFLLLMLLLAVFVLFLAGVIGVPALNAFGLFAGWLLATAAAAFWLWWEYTDYRNDIYVVTDDRIIDIEKQPLGLSAKQREGGLDRVQNVVAKQEGIWAALFRYGDVVISTAAADEGFTFMMVPNPNFVQSTIFLKLNQYRIRKAKDEDLRRQRDLIEALSVYHQLRGGTSGTAADGFGDRI